MSKFQIHYCTYLVMFHMPPPRHMTFEKLETIYFAVFALSSNRLILLALTVIHGLIKHLNNSLIVLKQQYEAKCLHLWFIFYEFLFIICISSKCSSGRCLFSNRILNTIHWIFCFISPCLGSYLLCNRVLSVFSNVHYSTKQG